MAVSKSSKFLTLIADVKIDKNKAMSGINQELQEVIKNNREKLKLDIVLNPAELKSLETLLSGKTIGRNVLEGIMAKMSALVKDTMSLNSKVNANRASEFIPIQKKEAQDKIQKTIPGASNIQVTGDKYDTETGHLKSAIILYDDINGAARSIVAEWRKGEVVLDDTINTVTKMEKEIKDIYKATSEYYGQLEKAQVLVDSFNGKDEVSNQNLLALQTKINAKKQEGIAILNEALRVKNLDTAAHTKSLATLEKEFASMQEAAALAAQTETQKRQSNAALAASEKLVKNEATIAQLEREIALNSGKGVSVINTRIEGLKSENAELQKQVALSKAARDNYESKRGAAINLASQKVDERYANQTLKETSKINKQMVAELKAFEIARQTGNKDSELAARKRLIALNELRKAQAKAGLENIKDAQVELDFQRRLELANETRIASYQVMRQEAEASANAKKASMDTKYGSLDSTTLSAEQRRLSQDQIEALNSSSKGYEELAKEAFGADAVITHYNRTIQEGGAITSTATVQFNRTGQTLDEVTLSVDALTGALRSSEIEVRRNGIQHLSFAERLSMTFKKLGTYVGVSTLIYGALNKIREGFIFITDLDKQLVQTALTLGLTREQTDLLGKSYSEMGIKMGKTTMEIALANTELVRQGLSLRESGERLQQVIKLSSVGMVSTADALKVITTGVNAMKVSAQDLSDVLVYGGQLSASSVEELGEAFQKVASSAYASNMRLTETVAILATMTEVTQEDASSVGTSLKTIIARFNNVTDAAEGSEDSLNKVQDAIESVGVKFVDSAGQIRNVYDILKDLNVVWAKLDKNTRSYIATQAAGTRQQNKFFAVMDNFNRVLELNNELTSAGGKLNEGYQVYLSGLESQINKTKASLEALWQNDIFPALIGAVNTLAQAGMNLVDSFGLIESVAVAGVGLTALTVMSKAASAAFEEVAITAAANVVQQEALTLAVTNSAAAEVAARTAVTAATEASDVAKAADLAMDAELIRQRALLTAVIVESSGATASEMAARQANIEALIVETLELKANTAATAENAAGDLLSAESNLAAAAAASTQAAVGLQQVTGANLLTRAMAHLRAGTSTFFTLLKAAAPWLLVLSAGVWAVMAAVKAYNEELELNKAMIADANAEIQSITNSYLGLSKTTNELVELTKEYNDLKAKAGGNAIETQLSSEDYAKFVELQSKIVELMPNVKQSMTASGETVLDVSSNYNILNKSLAENIALQKEAFMAPGGGYQTYLEEKQKDIAEYKSLEEKRKKAEEKIEKEKNKKQQTISRGSSREIEMNTPEQKERATKKAMLELDKAQAKMLEAKEKLNIETLMTEQLALIGVTDKAAITYATSIEGIDRAWEQIVNEGVSIETFFNNLKEEFDQAGALVDPFVEKFDALSRKVHEGDVGETTTKSISSEIARINGMLSDTSMGLSDSAKGEFKSVLIAYQDLLAQIEGDPIEININSNYDAAKSKIEALISAKEKLFEEDSKGLDYENAQALIEAGFDKLDIERRLLATGGDINKQKQLLNDLLEETNKKEIENLKLLQKQSEAMKNRFKTGGRQVEGTTVNANASSGEAYTAMSPELKLMIEFLQKLTMAFAGVGASSGEAKQELEKYFYTLSKITAIQQKLDELEFRDDTYNIDLTKERTAELKNLASQYKILEKERLANLNKLQTTLLKTNKTSNKYVEIQEEIRDEQEAIRDLALTQLQIETQLAETRASNFKDYSSGLSQLENLEARLSLADAQSDKGLADKEAITQSLIVAEKQLIEEKIAESILIKNELNNTNLSYSERISLITRERELSNEILADRTALAGYESSILDIAKQRADLVKEEKDNMQSLLDTVEQLVRQEEQDKIDAREKSLNLAKEELDIQLKSLDTQKEQADFEKDRLDKVKSINQIKQKIISLEAAASTGDIKAANEIFKLQEDLASKESDLTSFNTEKAYEDKKDALQGVYDQYEEKIKDANDESEAFLNNMGAVMERVQNKINDHLDGTIDLYQELIDWNTIHGTGIEKDVIDKWNAAYTSLEAYIELAKSFNINDYFNNYQGKAIQSGFTSVTGKELNAKESSALAQMKINSDNWTSAKSGSVTQTGTKEWLAAENKKLAKEFGFIIDKGFWYASQADLEANNPLYKPKTYDNGGLKPKGQIGIMAENVKEWVFDDNQLKAVQRMAIDEYLGASTRSTPTITNETSNTIQININGDITDKNVNKIAMDIKDIVAKVSQGQVEIFKQRGLKPSFNTR